MTYSMASLIKKTIRGRAYYYARECRRVDGKPTIVWQKYLGRADDIIAALAPVSRPPPSHPAQPREAIITDFGAVAALYDLAQQLQLIEHIDRHVPKSGSGPSVGTYLLLAAINRCVAPCSKAQIARWFEGTALRRLTRRPAPATDQPALLGPHGPRLSPGHRVHRRRPHRPSGPSTSTSTSANVLFDATNFFTFIDTFNARCTLAQPRQEQGRPRRPADRRLGPAGDGRFPHPVVPPDLPRQPARWADLRRADRSTDRSSSPDRRPSRIGHPESSTRGIAPPTTSRRIADSPYHFISSLVPTYHPDLLEIPVQRFRSLAPDGLPGVRAYRTTKDIFGVERTVVVTHNEALFVAQSRTLLREIAKRQHQSRRIAGPAERHQRGEVRGGKRPTMAGVRKTIDG